MISLLQQPQRDGYPTDFLLSRLRGRRQHLIAGADPASATARERLWSDLQREFRWVFAAMNRSLRQMFAPCFIYFELRNLQMMLRAIDARDQAELGRLCGQSMLQKQLLRQLQQCSGTDEALSVLDAWLAPAVSGWQQLAATHSAGSNRAVEQQLTDSLLQELAARPLQSELTRFVADLIDMRNLLTSARYLRWDLTDPPLLVGGADISRQLKAGFASQGMAGLQSVLQRNVVDAGADVALLESELLGRLSRKIEFAGRDPLGPALILDYLWRRYQAFRSAGLKIWAGEDFAAWEQLA